MLEKIALSRHEQLRAVIEDPIASGRYPSASDVLGRTEVARGHEMRLKALRQAGTDSWRKERHTNAVRLPRVLVAEARDVTR